MLKKNVILTYRIISLEFTIFFDYTNMVFAMKASLTLVLLFTSLLVGVYCSNANRHLPPPNFSYPDETYEDEKTKKDSSGKKKRRRRRRYRSDSEEYYGSSPSPSPSSPSPSDSPVSNIVSGFCDRNPLIQQAILGQIPGSSACGAVTTEQLAAITRLVIPLPPGASQTIRDERSYGSRHSPRTDNDFKGLTGLRTLETESAMQWGSSTFPSGFFSDLTSIEELNFDEDNLSLAGVKSLLLTLPSPPQNLRRINFGTDIGELGCTRGSQQFDRELLAHLGATNVNCPESCTLSYRTCPCALNDPTPSIVVTVVCPYP